MADPNFDYCNPVSVWESFAAWLAQAFASLFPPPPSNAVPVSIRPPFLSEPPFKIRERPGRFQVCKPQYGIFDTTVLPSAPLTMIREFAKPEEADKFIRDNPKVRLPAVLVNEILPDYSVVPLPASAQFNWTADPDAKNTAVRLDSFLNSVPVAASLPSAPLVTLNLARLPDGARALHLPKPGDPTKSLVLVDPFKIYAGTLQLCATYVHELTHAQRHQRRGFNRHELTSLLPRDDYVLLGLDEELASFKNAVTAVQQFLTNVPPGSRLPFTEWVATALEPPVKLYFAEGLASLPPATVETRVLKFVGDSYLLLLQDDYRDLHAKSLVPSAAANAWISSPEWAAIQATRTAWQDAGVL